MNLFDYVILGVLAVLLVLAIRYTIRHRGSCGGSGCAGCPRAGGCHSPKKEIPREDQP